MWTAVVGAVVGFTLGLREGLGAAGISAIAVGGRWWFERHVLGPLLYEDRRKPGPSTERWAQRCAELRTFAAAHRLGFNPRFRTSLSSQPGLPRWVYQRVDCWGHALAGRWRQRPVKVFDIGNVSYQPYAIKISETLVTVWTPYAMPQLRIWPEALADTLRQTLGEKDIDTESAEFNRAFCVRCEDPAWALEALTPQVMEMLLERPTFQIELHGQVMLLRRPGKRLAPDDLADALDLAGDLLDVLPKYLLEKRNLDSYDRPS